MASLRSGRVGMGNPAHPPMVRIEMNTSWTPNQDQHRGAAEETYKLFICGDDTPIVVGSKRELHLRLVQLREEFTSAVLYIEGTL